MRDRLRRFTWPVLVLGLAAVVVIGLVVAEPREPDRVETLAAQLRCPVCQSESVADSPSQTAREMRVLIAELVDEGRTDEEILDHFVSRYGQWILLDPPFTASTALLWLLPVLGLVAGIAVVARVGSHRHRPAVELTPERRAAVSAARADLDEEERA